MVTNVTKEWLLGESGTDGANANVGITGIGSGTPKYHSIPSTTTFPAGMIVNVVQVVKTDTQDMSTSGSITWTEVSNFEPSITPSATSSKILLNLCLTIGSEPYSVYAKVQAKTGSGSYADLTAAMGDASGSRERIMMSAVGGTADPAELSTMSMMFLDSPATTSARSYKVFFTARHSGSAHINKSQSDASADYSGRSISTFTLMEIAG